MTLLIRKLAPGAGVVYPAPMTNTDDMDVKDVEPGPAFAHWFDDIEVGSTGESGPVTATAEEIITFAERYDPLPMHTSEEGGRATEHGGLIASGVLTIAFKQRLIMSIERNTAIIGAAMIESQVFKRPVRPGDNLFMRQEVHSKRVSKSRPDRGIVVYDFVMTNQHDEIVLTSRDFVMILLRPVDA